MDYVGAIQKALQAGDAKTMKELIPDAISKEIPAKILLEECLLAGMNIVGERFRKNELFVPEVLLAARAMNIGINHLKPYLIEGGTIASRGRICIGTVQGDLHDIGKNIVKLMLESRGFEVVDLGVDVAVDAFIKTAIEKECRIIACSALLTTTMYAMERVVAEAKKAGIREQIKIMIGGAPITQAFCEAIGADAYTPNAVSAACTAVKLLEHTQFTLPPTG